ncbi:hypothetical protein ACQEU8_35910 [Streptomyces sp. CA-250714]|uniref:hypothetical protein n=1 Tax=Streptomyces sp. CA-250714 TaxID=3240060 RepID=UPI003D91B38B
MNAQVQATPAPAKPVAGLVLAVQELTVVQDRYDSLRSDNQGSSGDAPWPGGDGNLSDH